jgi:hypothetical protein
MDFLKKLFGGGNTASVSDFYTFHVRCDHCGETIEGRVNLTYELTPDYETGDGYHVRKVLMGSGLCFQQIEVQLNFDAAKQLQDKQISGGKFVE